MAVSTSSKYYDPYDDRYYYEQKMLDMKRRDMEMYYQKSGANEQAPIPKPETPKPNLKLLLLEQP